MKAKREGQETKKNSKVNFPVLHRVDVAIRESDLIFPFSQEMFGHRANFCVHKSPLTKLTVQQT